jgi:hypothetical protein
MGFEVEAASRLEAGPLGLPVLNQSGVDTSELVSSSDMRELAKQVNRWVDNARRTGSSGSMFDRSTFTPPDNPYDEMRAARAALDPDEVVGTVWEVTESFAFQGVKWEHAEEDDADIYNQISRDIDLDSVLRKQWRDIFTYSQVVNGMIWGWKEYTVRGKTEKGNRRKRKVQVWCPLTVRTIDPMKVVPVGGSGPFAGDYLAWCSTLDEVDYYRRAVSGDTIDPLMALFFEGEYRTITHQEERDLTRMGVDTSNLLLMNRDMVWRHTLTRPDYERFPQVRLKNLFPLLDMKRQLMKSDRAMLIGAANYILLIRKGSDDQPGSPEEIRHLKENYNFIAKLPVIISDHRLEVDIIAPKQDFTLKAERYDLIDTRLMMRLLNTLSLGSRGQRNETNVTLSRAVARGMENRRHMIARSWERHFARAIFNHPRNEGVFKGFDEPSLVYVPRNIALDIDAAIITAIMNLRARREISRDTILEHFGLDQATEAQRMEMEEEFYDDIFKTFTPFDSPEHMGNVGPGQGGRPTGGGQSSQDATKTKNTTPAGNPST